MGDFTHGLGPTGLFIGSFTPKLDDKGRLILPAKFRGRLGQGFVATRGLDRCVFLFPVDEFMNVHERLRKAPLEDKQARDYLRSFLGHAQDDVPDSQGRVLLSGALRSYASLTRDVAVVGMGSRVELWDAQTWERYLTDNEDGYAATGQSLFDY